MKNAFWIDFRKHKPLKEGKYLVLRYGDIDIAYWTGDYFNVKWVLDEDDQPMDIVYREDTVSFWMELPDKPGKTAEPTQFAQKNEFAIPAVSNFVCAAPEDWLPCNVNNDGKCNLATHCDFQRK